MEVLVTTVLDVHGSALAVRPSGTRRAILRRNLEKARLVAPGSNWLTDGSHNKPGALVMQG